MKIAYTFDRLSKAGQNKAIRLSLKEFNENNWGDELNGGYVDENTRDKKVIEGLRKDMSDGKDLYDGIRLYSSDGIPIYSADGEYKEIERPSKGFKFPKLSYKDEKSDKQYEVKIDSNGNAVIKFGKTGSTLREMKKSFATESEAIEYAYGKFKDKIKGGYTTSESKFDSKRRASKRNRGENKTSFRIMKAKRLNEKAKERFKPQMKNKKMIDPKDKVENYWVSEKVDGFRAIWTGKEFVSKTGNKFEAPPSWIARMPKDIQLDGELWLGRGNFQEGSSIVSKKKWDSEEEQENQWDRLTYVIFDSPSINKKDIGFTNTVSALNDILRGLDVGKTSNPKQIMGYESLDNEYGEVEIFNWSPALVQVGPEFASSEEAEAYLDAEEGGGSSSIFNIPSTKEGTKQIVDDIFVVDANIEFGLDEKKPYRIYADISVSPDEPLLEKNVNANVIVAPQIELSSLSQVEELVDMVFKKNGEGLMMRMKNSPFEPTNEAMTKRSSSILKVKPRFTEEGLVVGYEEGLGNRSGEVGSLIVKSTIKDGTKATWKLGSGLTQKDIANPPPKNSVIEYSFDGKTKRGIPRHGVFVRARPDLDPRAYSRRQSVARKFNGKTYSLFQRTGKANKLSKNNAQVVAKNIRSIGVNARVVPFRLEGKTVHSVYVGDRKRRN